MKKRAPFKFKQHFLDEWPNINSPCELAEMLEESEDVRKTLKPKSFDNSFKDKNGKKGRFKKFEQQPRKVEDAKYERSRSEESNFNGNHTRRRNHHFNSPHFSHSNSSRYKKTTDTAEETSNLVRTCSIASQGEGKSRNIILGKEPVTAVLDTGSLVSLIFEDISRKIIDRSELSQNRIVLSGIGGSQVSTKVSFKQDFILDEDEYCLTWHIVPTAQLKFEAVIGSDI
ncbi:hypothetical protein AVEN_88402-1 [Araneus ventricosus]|uniref:Peptidase A2 domain-containing protein n=1 Tax=Araneus ventricosus TaxID=182803 RepID=A0A4Y2CXN2_ARAVE|nr:hypothetical protein AVEN_19274-1 [Araneus ventricosus]GBM09267.1 hypothetical protein AVEN_88402-1 [Araneus ventricosus]